MVSLGSQLQVATEWVQPHRISPADANSITQDIDKKQTIFISFSTYLAEQTWQRWDKIFMCMFNLCTITFN